ncbi:MAG: serine hydrolase domain-containing protein, partial [Acidimicrobiales bacterium]
TASMDADRLARIDDHLRRRYVEPGKIAGCAVAVARRRAVAHCSYLGLADAERGTPVAEDTIWRAYSMTKPVTGVAMMTLYERGAFQLDTPVDRFIPSWRDIRVGEPGPDGPVLVHPRRPPSVRDLLTHTAGLGYGPGNADLDLDLGGLGDPVERPPAPRRGGWTTLADLAEHLAHAPLRFHPGTHWLYSFGTDVAARLVEVISGRPFDVYLRQEIFDPLGMVDTDFSVPDSKVDRFAANYVRNDRKELVLLDDPLRSPYRARPTFLSGGGGLVTTLPDYLRFARMLAGGGALEGTRLLSRKTVELMSINHLPGGAQLSELALPGAYGEVEFAGMGFGLTMAVGMGPAATGVAGSPGEISWGGAASTAFWVDPVEELTAVFMTQLMPSGTFDFRGQLRALVYQALAD